MIKNVYETEALYYLVKDIDHEPTKCYVNYGHGNELYYIDEIWNWDCSEDEYGVITGLEFDINAVVSKKRALSLAKDTKTPIKIKILELKYDEYVRLQMKPYF